MESKKATPLSTLILCALSGFLFAAAWDAGPLIHDGEFRAFPAFLYLLAIVSGVQGLANASVLGARVAEWLTSFEPTGKDGTARWATWKDLSHEIVPDRAGPFWGVMEDAPKKPLFIDYASNALTVAPAGSGKTVDTVIPMTFAIPEVKVVSDFKNELYPVLKPALEARGETALSLLPGEDGDRYSPVDIIVDDLYRPGGLRDVADDLRELCAQLLPEPAETEGDNSYWREGSRRIIADAILLEAMIEEYGATLSSVALLIEDRRALDHHLRWIIGVDLDGKPLSQGPMPIEGAPWAKHHDPEDVAEFASLVRARASNLLALMED